MLIAGDIPATVDICAKRETFVRVGREIEIGSSRKTSIAALEDLSPEQARLDGRSSRLAMPFINAIDFVKSPISLIVGFNEQLSPD